MTSTLVGGRYHDDDQITVTLNRGDAIELIEFGCILSDSDAMARVAEAIAEALDES